MADETNSAAPPGAQVPGLRALVERIKPGVQPVVSFTREAFLRDCIQRVIDLGTPLKDFHHHE